MNRIYEVRYTYNDDYENYKSFETESRLEAESVYSSIIDFAHNNGIQYEIALYEKDWSYIKGERNGMTV